MPAPTNGADNAQPLPPRRPGGPIRVLIIDDSALVRELLSGLLEGTQRSSLR